MRVIFWISLVLTIIGGVNWGLVGFIGFDLVAAISGGYNFISQTIYAVVGIASLIVVLSTGNILFLDPLYNKQKPLIYSRRKEKIYS